MEVLAICSWCGAELGLRRGNFDQPTHGICKSCKERQLRILRIPDKIRNGFYDSEPVLDATVTALLFDIRKQITNHPDVNRCRQPAAHPQQE